MTFKEMAKEMYENKVDVETHQPDYYEVNEIKGEDPIALIRGLGYKVRDFSFEKGVISLDIAGSYDEKKINKVLDGMGIDKILVNSKEI